MDAKLFKNFQVFIHTTDDDTPLDQVLTALHEHEASDPSGGQWRRVGFVPPLISTPDFFIDVHGHGYIACLQINERILPGAVLREKMMERIAAIEEQEGRRIGKKQYAEIKDEVAFTLLPQSHIRRKQVPIMFTDDHRTLIFTSSAKVKDDVVMALSLAAPKWLALGPAHLSSRVNNAITGTLTALAREGQTATEDIDDDPIDYLSVADAAVLKGGDKKTIRIKDKGVDEYDIQTLLKQDYTVTSLRLNHFEADHVEADVAFTLNEFLVFGGFRLAEIALKDDSGGTDEEAASDQYLTSAWAILTVAKRAINTVAVVMGGLKPNESQESADDADDL